MKTTPCASQYPAPAGRLQSAPRPSSLNALAELLESPEFPPSLDTLRFIETSPEPEPLIPPAQALNEPNSSASSRWGALLWATQWVQKLLAVKNKQQPSRQLDSGDGVAETPDSPSSDGKRKFAEAPESLSGALDVSKSTEAEAELTSDSPDAVTQSKRERYYYDPKRADEARQLYENNMPLGEIARKLSIQRRTLNRWLGLEADLAQQRDRVLALHHQKVPQWKMAMQLDLPLPRVVQILKEAGLVKKREQAHQRHGKDVREQALQLRGDGVDNADIAKRLGVPNGTVSFWVTQAGLSVPQKTLDDAQITALREEGQTQQEIAETLGVSREAVSQRLKKQALSAPQIKYSGEVRAKVAELYHQNLTLKDIARNLGMPQGSVGYILNSQGLKNRQKAPMTEQQKQQAIDMRANGHSVQQIVKALGFSQHTISKVTYQAHKKQKTAESSDAE